MKKEFYIVLAVFVVLILGIYYLVGSSRNNDKDIFNSNKPLNVNGTDMSKQNNNQNKQTLSVSSSSSQSNNTNVETPTEVIDKNKNYQAILKTAVGDITIDLDVKMVPFTVNNFVFLAKKSFYNNTIFHRVVKGFMIQGGDPKGDGTGGPGYRFKDEPFEGEYKRGVVAMANSGPNTNGSQFFIMHQDYNLPKNYVIFGKVSQGIEVVDKIAEAEVTNSPSGEKSKPINPVKVNSVEIIEK